MRWEPKEPCRAPGISTWLRSSPRKSAEQALATMTAEPYVNVVPLMIGGRGRDEVHDFYANHFLSQIPPDMEIGPRLADHRAGPGRR